MTAIQHRPQCSEKRQNLLIGKARVVKLANWPSWNLGAGHGGGMGYIFFLTLAARAVKPA